MRRPRWVLPILLIVALLAVATGLVIWRGFSARSEPSSLEKTVARTVRDMAIPRDARHQKNPWKPTADNLNEAREHFTARCAMCHGVDGQGQTQLGRSL